VSSVFSPGPSWWDVSAEFGCPVRFDRAANALVFPARFLSTPSRFANPLAAERIEELAIALETRAPAPPSEPG
jgi:hypothetical protein